MSELRLVMLEKVLGVSFGDHKEAIEKINSSEALQFLLEVFVGKLQPNEREEAISRLKLPVIAESRPNKLEIAYVLYTAIEELLPHQQDTMKLVIDKFILFTA